MFEKFTQEARLVIVGAQEQARALDHPWIGTEHLLLGVAELPPTAGARRVLEAAGCPADVLRDAVEQIVDRGEKRAGAAGHVPFTTRCKRVLELALRESTLARSTDIHPEHLLLGILDEETSTGARTLAGRGVDVAELRSALGSRVPVVTVSAGMRSLAVEEVLRVAERLAAGTPVTLDHLRRALDQVEGTGRPGTDG